jgi:putative inorganic carbon (HCO3(-)) transporter
MSRATAKEVVRTEDESASLKLRVANVLGQIVFVSLLCLIALTAVPYGTSQAWWLAFFVCTVFILAILWLIEGSIRGSWFRGDWQLILPLAAFALFAFLQTLQIAPIRGNVAGISLPPWNAISADPYQTRFFVLDLLALTLAGLFFSRYATTERRVRIVINVVIGVAVASAIFGILRQTMQHGPGFGLPLLLPDLGYGQFINKNHFAFMMEMSLGLILGLILGGGIRREQALIYFASLLPIWIGLVLSGSRGGLVAMLAQIVIAALLLSVVARKGHATEPRSRLLSITRSLPVRAVLILVLIGGVVFGTLWLGGDRLAASIEQSRAELNPDPDNLRYGASRNEIWRTTWKMFAAHPIVGVGMGGYWTAVPAFHNASGYLTPQEAHNDYLELLASGGLVGLALAIWFGVVVFSRTRKNLGSPNRFRRAACFGATIGIAGVAVHSLLDFGLHTITNALVFTTLIAIATSKGEWKSARARLHE